MEKEVIAMNKTVLKICDGYENFIEKFTVVLSYSVVAMLIMLLYEILSRFALNSPTIWVHEISLYVFGAMSILVGPYLLKNKGHITIDIFYENYKGKVKNIIDIVTNVAGIAWCFLYVRYGIPIVIDTIKYNELSITPLRAPQWPIRLMVPIAGVLVILQSIVNIIRIIERFSEEGGVIDG